MPKAGPVIRASSIYLPRARGDFVFGLRVLAEWASPLPLNSTLSFASVVALNAGLMIYSVLSVIA